MPDDLAGYRFPKPEGQLQCESSLIINSTPAGTNAERPSSFPGVGRNLSLPPTRYDLTQGQKPEGRLKWG